MAEIGKERGVGGWRRGVAALLAAVGLWGTAWHGTATAAGPPNRAGRGAGATAQGLLVEPMEIRTEVAPGATATATVRIGNRLARPVAVEATVVDAVQRGNGVPDFDAEVPALGERACRRWVKVDDAPGILAPGDDRRLVVRATPPKGVRGERLCAILVVMKPEAEAGEAGRIRAATTIVLRYAVLTRVTLTGSAGRPAVEARQPRAEWGAGDEAPVVQVDVANTGEVRNAVSVEALVLESDGSRIRDRVLLESLNADKPVTRQTVYPFGYVTFRGRLTAPATPGDYPVRVLVRHGRNQTVSAEATLTVTAAQPAAGGRSDGRRVRWEPERLKVRLLPGGERLVTARLTNPMESPVRGALQAETAGETCTGWRIEAPTKVELPARGGVGVPVRVAVAPVAGEACDGRVVVTAAGDSMESVGLTIALSRAGSSAKPEEGAPRSALP